MEIPVLVPDVNESVGNFSVIYKDGKEIIRIGLSGVAGVGESVTNELISVRKSKPFKDMFDVANRCDSSKIKKTSYEALIESGAFDSTFPKDVDRSRAYYSISSILEGNKASAKANKKVLKGQVSMFGDDVMFRKFEYATCEKWSEDEVFRRERARIGLFLTGHPLRKFLPMLKNIDRKTYIDYMNLKNNTDFYFAGVILENKIFTTKNNNQMASVIIEDEHGGFDCLVFSKILESKIDLISDGKIVAAKGRIKINYSDDEEIIERKVIINEIDEIEFFGKTDNTREYKEKINSAINDSDEFIE
jgi:DNA polymerase-3 subunit alpha